MGLGFQAPSYVLGQADSAEFRLELLNELTGPEFVEAMRGLPNQKVRILNIGCGSGHLEEMLSKMFFDSQFFGIDLSAKRIEEARKRTAALSGSNTYTFVNADLTSARIEKLDPCDILIFRFVLSHLPHPGKHLKRFLPLVRPGGVVCFQELASNGSEYFCNIKNCGYEAFVNITAMQAKAQQSSFAAGFDLYSVLSSRRWKIKSCILSQPVLRTVREKSILSLGVKEAAPLLLQKWGKDKLEKATSSLEELQTNKSAFCLYTRSISVIAQTPDLS